MFAGSLGHQLSPELKMSRPQSRERVKKLSNFLVPRQSNLVY